MQESNSASPFNRFNYSPFSCSMLAILLALSTLQYSSALASAKRQVHPLNSQHSDNNTNNILVAGFPFSQKDTGAATNEPVAPDADKDITKAKRTSKKTAKKNKDTPVLVPNGALISLLKDLSRCLEDSNELTRIKDADEKRVLGVAQKFLAKALANPRLEPNRIVERSKDKMTTEAWPSGDIILGDSSRGSLTATWAKHVNGTIIVTITGYDTDKTTPPGKTIGEFMVVLSGRSSIEKGFDIQSQSDVSFWLAKLVAVTVDADCCNSQTALNMDNRKEPGVLPESEQKYQNAQSVPVIQSRNEAKAKSKSEKRVAQNKKHLKKAEVARVSTASDDKGALAIASEPGIEAGIEPGVKATNTLTWNNPKEPQSPPAAAQTDKTEQTATTMMLDSTGDPISPALKESDKLSRQIRSPSPTAVLVLPERAIAGQSLTVGVLDANRSAQSGVELSFNGTTLVTDALGQTTYRVPDDATPGQSLNVSLSAKPEFEPGLVEILQPLALSQQPQVPRIERVSQIVSNNGVLTIDGHNFEGLAPRNLVAIDGRIEGQVKAASPVQLKVALPNNLSIGSHSIAVSLGDRKSGLNSNLAVFHLVSCEVRPDPKEATKNQLTKLIVKVIGTTSKVQVHLTNQSPEVIKLAKGNDIHVITAGGRDNSTLLNVERIRKGSYRVVADLE